MNRKWVTNASPLILLGKIGRIVWLESLSKELVIPDGVAVEVRAGIESDAAANWIANSGSIYIREIGKKDIETVKKKGSICIAQLEVGQMGKQLTYIFGLLFNTLACMHAPIFRARVGGTT